MALLEAKGICKSFGSVQVLHDVDFAAHEGEVVALVGDNGAGKSTLIKTLSGVGPADKGEISFAGEPARIRTPTEAAKLGITVVYQDLALCDNLDVVANLFLGQELTTGRTNAIDELGMERKALELLSRLAVHSLQSVRADVGTLSGGQRQTVAIARAMLGEPRLVILDEPTAALGVIQTEQVLGLVERLRDQGLAIIFISHNLANVFEVADRIVVLRLGRVAGEFAATETTRRGIVAAITGAEGDLRPARAEARQPVLV
jgi:D-xylose transport system ATP-binding protein